MPTQCPLHTGKVSQKYLNVFKVMVCTKFLQFRRQGDITHGPSQLELSFLYPTPLPNAIVCVEVLWPSQPNGVMSSVVSLPIHTFTGQA